MTKAAAKTPRKVSREAELPSPTAAQSPTLGEYAHAIIDRQYRRIVKQEQHVLKDKNPEHLHQMRVGTRRLRTALQIFGGAVQIPKAAGEKQIRNLARVLGGLRDLDVQIAALTSDYCPRLNSSEQKRLNKAFPALNKQRQRAKAAVESSLHQPSYDKLKAAYENWLGQPKYNELAELPLLLLLPDLLSPLLADLLLHPGWLVSVDDLSETNQIILHDLRKTCKRARYQTEFFTDFYDASFQEWMNEIKTLQEHLGKVQDTHILLELLTEQLPKTTKLPELEQIVQAEQRHALVDWEALRHRYLDPDFRRSLHQMILSPKLSDAI